VGLLTTPFAIIGALQAGQSITGALGAGILAFQIPADNTFALLAADREPDGGYQFADTRARARQAVTDAIVGTIGVVSGTRAVVGTSSCCTSPTVSSRPRAPAPALSLSREIWAAPGPDAAGCENGKLEVSITGPHTACGARPKVPAAHCDNAVSVLGSLDLPKIEPMSVVPGMSPAPTAICMFSVTLHLSWFSSTRSSLP
jgi:hypothetical protein